MDIATKLSDLRADLSECRRAITYRGGEISATAGFKEVAEKIASLPASSSIGTVVDESSSLLKIVPVDSTKYCYLKSLGGMTYKSNNLIPFPYFGKKGVGHTQTINGLTFTVNEDRSVTINGTATGTTSYYILRNLPISAGTYSFTVKGISVTRALASLISKETSAHVKNFTQANSTSITTTFTITADEAKDCNLCLHFYTYADEVLNNVRIYPMLNAGSTALPYEDYYEGLRDNKATAIKNYGANYLKPYYSAGYTQTKGGITYTVIDDDGTFTINGTANGTPAFVLANYLDLPIDDYYLAGNCVSGTWVSGVEVYTSRYHASTYNVASIKIPSNALPTWISVQIKSGTVVNNLTFKPMLSRKQVIPYTPYHEPITYPIPEALQGTGKGVEGAADTIDFENGKAITNCTTVVLDGTESWAYVSAMNLVYMTSKLSQKGKGDSYIISNALMKRISFSNSLRNAFQFGGTSDPIENYGITSAEDWKNYLAELYASGNPLIVTYAVEEPTTEDIDTSAFDNLIEVEGGGSLEIITDNGMAVPTTFIYQTIV